MTTLQAACAVSGTICKFLGVDASPPPRLFLQERLLATREGIAEQAAELAGGLQRRQAVAAARALLELMQARPAAGGWLGECK